MSRPVPPRIVHVIHRLDVGGLENGVVNLVNRMPPDRYRHSIVCLSGYSASFRSRITRDGVDVVSLDKRVGKDVAIYGRMWRELRRLRPDVIHTRNLGTVDMQWVGAAAGIRARVHGEHGWEASDPLGRNPRSLRIRRACRPVIKRYVPMSQDIADWLVRDVGVDATRIRQLYSGVDTARFHPADPSSTQRARLAQTPWPEGFIGDDSLVIGTIGRLDPVKNQRSLLEVVRTIRQDHPDVGSRLRLIIAGDGPLRDELPRAIAELGLADQVWLAGSRSDTADVLRALDVFVLPSLNEGISNTVLEAMASGLPVVAANVGGNPEVVLDGVTGTLYPATSPDGLVPALLPYLREPSLRRAHGGAGRDRAVQDFSLDAMVRRYLDLYDELLAPASAGRAGHG